MAFPARAGGPLARPGEAEPCFEGDEPPQVAGVRRLGKRQRSLDLGPHPTPVADLTVPERSRNVGRGCWSHRISGAAKPSLSRASQHGGAADPASHGAAAFVHPPSTFSRTSRNGTLAPRSLTQCCCDPRNAEARVGSRCRSSPTSLQARPPGRHGHSEPMRCTLHTGCSPCERIGVSQVGPVLAAMRE